MRCVFDKSYIVRGIRKTDDWVGWTDGYSLIIGVDIPFVVENNEIIEPVTQAQVSEVIRDEYIPFDEGVEVELVKTPIATGVSKDLEIFAYTSLDYFDLWVNFGLQHLFEMRYLPSTRIGIYTYDFNFIGFFSLYRYDIFFEPYTKFLKELRV